MNIVLGVIGAGYISQFHFAAYKKMGVKVARVSDVNLGAASAAAAPFGATVSSDWRDVIEDPAVNVVSVLVPTPLHGTVVRAALEAGKNVVCEKTLTLSAAESLELGRLAESKGLHLYTGYMKRFFPACRKAKELVGRLGRLVAVNFKTRQDSQPANLYTGEVTPPYGFDADGKSRLMKLSGGGILTCGGSHMLDLLCYLCGAPSSVYARQFRRPGKSELDIVTHAMYGYADGCNAMAEFNWHPLKRIGYQSAGWDEGFEIFGENGIVELETPYWNQPLRNPPLLRHYDDAAGTWTEYRTPLACPFEEAERSFHAWMEAGGQPAEFDRFVGYRVDQLIESTYKSAAENRPVDIPWAL